MAFYPLWHATSDGRPLPTRRGAMADLEVRSPGPGARIDLVYERGAAEVAGVAISALSIVALAALWVFTGGGRDRPGRRARRPGP